MTVFLTGNKTGMSSSLSAFRIVIKDLIIIIIINLSVVIFLEIRYNSLQILKHTYTYISASLSVFKDKVYVASFQFLMHMFIIISASTTTAIKFLIPNFHGA
jgi:uncharacterized protein YebE (UPF0316 family)